MDDFDEDGIQDSVDVDQTRGSDADGDSIDDAFDIDFVPSATDTDGDGIIDSADPDPNAIGYGIPQSVTGGTPTLGAATPDQGVDRLAAAEEFNAIGEWQTSLSGCSIHADTIQFIQECIEQACGGCDCGFDCWIPDGRLCH